MSDVERYGVIALTLMGVLLLGILLKDELPWADSPEEVKAHVEVEAGRKVSNKTVVIPRRSSPPVKRSASNTVRLDPVSTPTPRSKKVPRERPGAKPNSKDAAALASHRVAELSGLKGAFKINEPAIAYPGPNASKSTEPEVQPAPGAPKMHEIARNETLSSIAAKYLGSSSEWEKLVEWNPGIDARSLKIGQKILVSRNLGDPAPKTTKKPVIVKNPAAQSGGTYVVQSGDTLSGIASKVMGSIKYTNDLFKANDDILKTKNDLRVGQTLKIP